MKHRCNAKFLVCFLTIAMAISLPASEPANVHPDIAAFYRGLQSKKPDPKLVTDDLTFLRRVWLDLTGRLPDIPTIQMYAADTDPNKREKMIDTLLGSEAFTDRWTTFFEDLFWNHSYVEEAVFRNPFHVRLKEMVAQNMPWDQMARHILTEHGQGSRERSAFTFWLIEGLFDDYRLDYLDDQIGFITESMLGIQMECISCHDGAYHLEDVNKGLSVMRRDQFWGMAAFLSKSSPYLPRSYQYYESKGDREFDFILKDLQLVDIDDPSFVMSPGFLPIEDTWHHGEYVARSEAGEGMRSPRNGGTVAPRYFTTGEGVRSGETRRQALARHITSDRQFARNMVNRLWAHFFGEGFVEPLDGWDLGRIDPRTAAGFETTVQPRNPELMEHLTDVFIDLGYDLRAMIRLICNTNLYQINFTATPKPEKDTGLRYWESNIRVHRIEAEAIVDSIFQILAIPRRYVVTGMLDKTFTSTWQMPDTYEPNAYAIYENDHEFVVTPESLGFVSEDHYLFVQYGTMELLRIFGMGDRFNQIARDNTSSVQTGLAMMNNESFHYWFLGESHSPLINGVVRDLELGNQTPEDIVRGLFIITLLRPPSDREAALFREYLRSEEREAAVADMVWALFNHPDFLFKR